MVAKVKTYAAADKASVADQELAATSKHKNLGKNKINLGQERHVQVPSKTSHSDLNDGLDSDPILHDNAKEKKIRKKSSRRKRKTKLQNKVFC